MAADRTGRVQAALGDGGLDALLLAAPPNVAYVTGWRMSPHERLIALVVPREGPLRVVAPSLEAEAARGGTPAGSELHVWRDDEGPAAALAAALRGLGRVGFERDYLTVAQWELARAAAPDAELAAADPLIAGLRSVKDEQELDRLRGSAAILDAVLAQLLAEEMRPGRTEAELAAAFEGLARDAGAEAMSFPPLVLTGAKSALPHGHSDGTRLAAGDLLILDVGVVAGGYCSDITRTVVVGADPDERQRELYEVVLRAHDAGIAAARAGTPARDVDRAARAVIEQAGHGELFIHRTGHGLGIEVHEPPYLNGANAEPLRAGNVVTIEPGIYVEGWGGIRIEDDVVVTGGEPELLTHAPYGLDPAA